MKDEVSKFKQIKDKGTGTGTEANRVREVNVQQNQQKV